MTRDAIGSAVYRPRPRGLPRSLDGLGTRPFVQRLGAALRGAEPSEAPDSGPAVSPMVLREAEPVYAVHLAERTRRLFWADRQ